MPRLSTKLRYLLLPLALFYWGTIFWRNLFYSIGFFVTRRLPVPVISVGNLSVGGTGKTSMVIYLAEKLQLQGVAPVIVSRGYRRKTSGTGLVSDGKKVMLSWQEAGDEPYFMANVLSGVPIVVDEVRYRGAVFAIERFNPDVIVLDDAFQHRSLDRDIDIVLLNSNDPLETYKLLPYGKLREPWNHLRRADLIFWTKANLKPPHPTLHSKVLQTKVPTFACRVEPDPFLRSANGQTVPLDALKGKKTVAFCGIGDPDSFRHLLQRAGAQIVHFKAFADHHVYTRRDLENLTDTGEKEGVDLLVTTEKDIFKVVKWVARDVRLYALQISFVPSPEGEKALLTHIEQELRLQGRGRGGATGPKP
ncbi:MAG: tetraacyldisaccharide 4'-kinase [Candidatus Neomarinimicrobiota bacterium]